MKLDYDAHTEWRNSIRTDRMRNTHTDKAVAEGRRILAERKQKARLKRLITVLVIVSGLYTLSAIGAIP